MDKEINRIIAQYRQRLENLKIKVKNIFLYGSYATGKADENSNIDLVVISDDFKDIDLWERLSLLGRARIGIRVPMEILGFSFTPDEFANEYKGTFIGDEVKTKGAEVI